MSTAPSLRRERDVERVHHWNREKRNHLISPRAGEVDDGAEAGDGLRGPAAVRAQSGEQDLQWRGGELLSLNAQEDLREQAQVLERGFASVENLVHRSAQPGQYAGFR